MSVVDNIFSVLAYSLAFSLVGLAVFLSTKVFKLVDLTCESSFALGACVYGSMVLSGSTPVLAVFVSMLIGYFAGVVTASLMSYIKLNSIVASLLTVGGLQSLLIKLGEIKIINPMSVFGNLSPISNFILVLIIVGIVSFLFYRLLISEYGLSMRIYGDGEIITESMGVNGVRCLSIGLGIENAMCALSGALVAQIVGDFSISIGSGCIIFGIASIMIGEKIIENNGIKTAIIGVFFGSVCFQVILKIVVARDFIGLDKEYNNVIMAIILIIMVALKQDGLKYIKEDDRRE